MEGENVVYFVKAGEYIKIGLSKNFDRRITNIQSSLPCKAEIISAFYYNKIIDMELAEHYWHTLFAQYHQIGEWFWYKPIVNFLYSSPEEQLKYIERRRKEVEVFEEDEFLGFDSDSLFGDGEQTTFFEEYATEEQISRIKREVYHYDTFE